jgi:hypothetical protein
MWQRGYRADFRFLAGFLKVTSKTWGYWPLKKSRKKCDTAVGTFSETYSVCRLATVAFQFQAHTIAFRLDTVKIFRG